ncbi:N-6 DNA methylase [Streptomyces antimicrobicus]|uniref:N-6 DNA methylase n=1 Tax=Streptomyces antimicrobicus TaxID=2883108 RepID=A0ABS8B706_9ACTN|nr:N-6 DNA methylase [Streptomyces antimicrobicus]MCB5180368.1 N-6 DNA methylase [Streptomyces antimicrobicus]
MPEHTAAEVTAAGIARMAGVGRAAVSNWRRRHADFPRPVGGTPASPSFALADVEDWLRAQGKLAEVPLRERVWQQVLGHPGGAVAALVEVGRALLVVRERPTQWLELTAVSDARMAALLPDVAAPLLAARLGPDHPLTHLPARPGPDPAPAAGASAGPAGAATVPLLRAAARLAAETGARQAFEFLVGRYLDANPRQYTLTPQGPAELMAALAGPARSALDPACGTGALLRAVRAAPGGLVRHGQDAAPELAALTALRLALHGAGEVRAAGGDSLRADAFPQAAVDVVLCHPPFNERAWGHEDLAYDPRWEYGLPARAESELAWVQHCLAHLREGGTAVLLMPPAAAARRSGRRIRADLLRRGALRAVVALPAGAAPPYGVPLHLWVLRRPVPGAPAPADLLLVDAAEPAPTGGAEREKASWPAVHTLVTGAWAAYDRPGGAVELPAGSRAVSVIELLDDDVDLTPGRHLPPPAAPGGLAELADVRERLDRTLHLAAELTPPPAAPGDRARPPVTTLGELARTGALVLHTGTGSGAPVPLAAGDVVVPAVGGTATARVVTDATAGAALGRNLVLLRPDPAALDPWFLAGFLRGTATARRASSHASTATRLDVRRLQLPRLPLADQRRYGERFRALAAFEDALRAAARLGEQLVQGLYDGLSDGTVGPS